MLDLEAIGVVGTLFVASFFKMTLCDRRSSWETYSRPNSWTDDRQPYRKQDLDLPLAREVKIRRPTMRRWPPFNQKLDQDWKYNDHRRNVPNNPHQALLFKPNDAKTESIEENKSGSFHKGLSSNTPKISKQQSLRRLEDDSLWAHKSSSRKVNAEEAPDSGFGIKGLLLDDVLRLVITIFIIVIIILASMVLFLLHSQFKSNRIRDREFPDSPSSDDETMDDGEEEHIPLLTRGRCPNTTVSQPSSNHRLDHDQPAHSKSQESNISDRCEFRSISDTGESEPLPLVQEEVIDYPWPTSSSEELEREINSTVMKRLSSPTLSNSAFGEKDKPGTIKSGMDDTHPTLQDENKNGVFQKESKDLKPEKYLTKRNEEPRVEKKDSYRSIHQLQPTPSRSFHNLTNANARSPSEKIGSEYRKQDEHFPPEITNSNHSSELEFSSAKSPIQNVKKPESKFVENDGDQQSPGNFKKSSYKDLFKASLRKSKEKLLSRSSDDLSKKGKGTTRKSKVHPQQECTSATPSCQKGHPSCRSGSREQLLTEPSTSEQKGVKKRVACPLNNYSAGFVCERGQHFVVQDEDHPNQNEFDEIICRHRRDWSLYEDSELDGDNPASCRRSNVHEMVRRYYHIAGMSSQEVISSENASKKKSTKK